MTQNETVFTAANVTSEANSNEVINTSNMPANDIDIDEEDEEDELSELLSEEYKSEALTKLREEYIDKGNTLQTLKFGSKKYQIASEQVAKLTGDIRKEIAGIKQQRIEAERKAKQAAMYQLLIDIADRATAIGNLTGQNAPNEVMTAANEALQLALDTAANQFIYGTAAKSIPASNGNAAPSGSVRLKVEELYKQYVGEGLTDTQIVKKLQEVDGIARGTANTYTKDFRDNNGFVNPNV
jgi:hypothetical protein